MPYVSIASIERLQCETPNRIAQIRKVAKLDKHFFVAVYNI